LPELDPSRPQTHEATIRRGAEKKRYLLAYLRKHLEELRPVARRQGR
jgi:hypothetical protein